MTRTPPLAPRCDQVAGSVFSREGANRPAPTAPLCPLHVGDTWRDPPEGCQPWDLAPDDDPQVHRYTEVPGLPVLRERVAERISRRGSAGASPEQVVVTSGATAGLAIAAAALVAPGQEVLVPVPAWPLFAGGLRAQGARPVEVPWLGVKDPDSATRALEARATSRTVAVYINTPNNPTGQVWPPDVIDAVVQVARRRGWWVIADEVYEDYVYEGSHDPVWARAPERVVSAWSCSKAYGMAGCRVGWVAAPVEVAEAIARLQTYATYCPPRVSQRLALRALEGAGDRWMAQSRQRYADVGRQAARLLGVPPPEGSTFLFVDVAESVKRLGMASLMDQLWSQGVMVAPGSSFGPYPEHLRICFTSAAPEVVLAGVQTLAAILAER